MINDSIMTGLRQAKSKLSSVIKSATLITATKTYNVATGVYDVAESSTNIEIIFTKLDYTEEITNQFLETDFKIIVFNLDNLLTITGKDFISIDASRYSIVKSQPTRLVDISVIYELVLRK